MNEKQKKDIIFISVLITVISAVCIFNYIIDPYYLFRDTTIKGFNNVKIHKYSNKRKILYSDIKINHKNKTVAFTGNCLLSNYGLRNNNIAFYTIPMVRVEEAYMAVKAIHEIAPDIKKIYLGIFFDELWNEKNDEITDILTELDNKKLNYQDFINLFFSWNTTKYSIETLKDSIVNHGKDIIYIYPYREIAKKTYNNFPSESIDTVKKIYNYAKENNIELVIYYSPIHVTKKIHIYENNQWNNNQSFKKQLAEMTDFYDYSFFNQYNHSPLDENSIYFIDNIHPTNIYNNLVVKDLLSDNKEIGILVTKNNVKELTDNDTRQLEQYIQDNKSLVEKIKNVKYDDFSIKIKKLEN